MSTEAGSSGEPDVPDEDVMRDEQPRGTDFVGKASEAQQLRKLHETSISSPSAGCLWGAPEDSNVAISDRLAALSERQNGHPTPPLIPTSKASFYLDDEVFQADMMVDPYEMPSFEIAETLLQAYMDSAQNSFPILAKKTFIKRFYHCTSFYKLRS